MTDAEKNGEINDKVNAEIATKIKSDTEVYAEVYGRLVNKVLPAFVEAVDELVEENYPAPGEFMINSMAGITATVLRDAIRTTANETGMPLPKARKRVLKQLNERANLFVRRLDEAGQK